MARTIPDPSVHVFFAGVPSDLVTIEAMLATMPICAYGQIVIETDGDLPELQLPRRVQLRRVGPATDIFGELRAGESLASAADAWLTEWMPDEASSSHSNFFAWIGCAGSRAAREAEFRLDHSLRAGLAGN